MKVLIFGLCTLALTIAAPSPLAQSNIHEVLSDVMLNSEDFWLLTLTLLPIKAPEIPISTTWNCCQEQRHLLHVRQQHCRCGCQNCQYTDLIVNSSSKIFVTGSQLNLMTINSTLHVYAFNSQIRIANATSSITVHAIKNSTVTYIPAPVSDYEDVVEANKFEYFRLPAFHHSSNSQKSFSMQPAWEKLEKMAQENVEPTPLTQ
uniref:Uncharacterized protein n=1 Tax=Ditylenchus dipsaci TaxID=166011 RepID=A0A915DHI2_9BILA